VPAESLIAELPGDTTDPLYGKVRVVVMNNAPNSRHTAFSSLQRRCAQSPSGKPSASCHGRHFISDAAACLISSSAFHHDTLSPAAIDATSSRGMLQTTIVRTVLCIAGTAWSRKCAEYVSFVQNPGKERDPTPGAREPDDLNNPDDTPGREVRKQTLDLIQLLEHSRQLAQYYMFMEDDFRRASAFTAPSHARAIPLISLAPLPVIMQPLCVCSSQQLVIMQHAASMLASLCVQCLSLAAMLPCLCAALGACRVLTLRMVCPKV